MAGGGSATFFGHVRSECATGSASVWCNVETSLERKRHRQRERSKIFGRTGRYLRKADGKELDEHWRCQWHTSVSEIEGTIYRFSSVRNRRSDRPQLGQGGERSSLRQCRRVEFLTQGIELAGLVGRELIRTIPIEQFAHPLLLRLRKHKIRLLAKCGRIVIQNRDDAVRCRWSTRRQTDHAVLRDGFKGFEHVGGCLDCRGQQGNYTIMRQGITIPQNVPTVPMPATMHAVFARSLVWVHNRRGSTLEVQVCPIR